MIDSGDNLSALSQSVGLHLVVLAVLVVGIQLRRESPIIAANIIEATIVDESAFAGGIERIELEEPPEPVIDDTAEREREFELEQERLADEQRRQEELAERQRAEELAERQRAEELVEIERQQELAELKRQQELEELKRQQELAELERQKELAERKRAEDEARLLAEEEAKKQAEEEAARRQAALEEQRQREATEKKRREEEEARRRVQAEIERREREAASKRAEAESQLAAGLAEEERRRSAVDAGLLAVYLAKIKQKIERYWRPPPFNEGDRCILRARQLRTGDLASVDSVDCGGNAALERSLEAAVTQASPFPLPDDPSLFDPNLRLEFDPDN